MGSPASPGAYSRPWWRRSEQLHAPIRSLGCLTGVAVAGGHLALGSTLSPSTTRPLSTTTVAAGSRSTGDAGVLGELVRRSDAAAVNGWVQVRNLQARGPVVTVDMAASGPSGHDRRPSPPSPPPPRAHARFGDGRRATRSATSSNASATGRHGLAAPEAARRLRRVGPNVLAVSPGDRVRRAAPPAAQPAADPAVGRGRRIWP